MPHCGAKKTKREGKQNLARHTKTLIQRLSTLSLSNSLPEMPLFLFHETSISLVKLFVLRESSLSRETSLGPLSPVSNSTLNFNPLNP
ncbi:hypothetical protein RchiOBHm_Chr1g0363601 [Rosa chinensis]|uniref:Uncharacterized protein n=1 Tax=Rosa chinensis TaxID=74649 RepID=A0A2P6SJI6_ROSCH|nr:hypothetical protein RchiOBHm_Chr1g0363601 [Rosa chinensis]